MIDFHMPYIIGKQIQNCNSQTDPVRYQNTDMNTLGQRLKECRRESGLSQKEVCARTGMTQGNLSELENDKYPTSSYVPHLAALYRVEALWLAEGKGPRRYADTEFHGKGTSKALIEADTVSDLVPIKRGDFKLSAGVCGYVIEYSTDDDRPPIFMAKRWFDQNGYKPDRLLAVKVSGRSMEPRMYDGDLVIVNMDNTRLVDGQTVAANYEGELVIKRLKRDAGQWYLSSDNPDKVLFGDKICQGDCGVIGHVVYRQTEHV